MRLFERCDQLKVVVNIEKENQSGLCNKSDVAGGEEGFVVVVQL